MISEHIERLGTLLAQNHVLSSIDIETLNQEKNWEKILCMEHEIKSRTVAVVVGAGASINAGMPLGIEALNKLRKKFKINEEAFEYTLSELESVYEYERNTFETNLLAFNRFRPNILLDELKNMYAHRYYPIFCYEILAHLLKHRFVDVIINFNFDEFLDQSIEDEVGTDEYYKIISDGDCPEHLLYTDPSAEDGEKPDLPIYIKPHGTASHKSTLRFTREDYFRLPTDIKRLIKNLLIKPNTPLILISVGFNMQSFEFNEIIKEQSMGSEIFYINKSEPKIQPPIESFDKKLIKIDEKNDIDAVFNQLWESTCRPFKDTYKPRSIDRHKILSSIFRKYCDFSNNLNKQKKHFKDYCYSRTIVELLIYAAKSKGLINLSHAATNRCGTYFDLYQQVTRGYKTRKSFIDILNNFGFVEAEYGFELFQQKNKLVKEGISNSNKLIMNIEDFKAWIKQVVPKIVEIAPKVSLSFDPDPDLEKNIYQYFENLYGPEETEIRVSKNHIYNKIFTTPYILKTKTSLKYQTLSLLKEDWNQLLIVAETGQWFIDPNVAKIVKKRLPELQGQGCIKLIVADNSYEDHLIKMYGSENLCCYKLNWWEHNRHFTICLDSGMPISCIYFSRRLRSQNVTPLYLDSKDSKKVLGIFCMYMEKTKNNNDRMVDFSRIKNTKGYINKSCYRHE